MKKRIFALLLCLIFCVSACLSLAGCEGGKGYQKNRDLDTTKEVVLKIASGKDTWPEMENVAAKFEEIYPNCTIDFEFIESYAGNLPIRLAQDDQKIDIFRTTNIQKGLAGDAYQPYAVNLISEESKKILDLSGTNAGLVANFRYSKDEEVQYAIPYGGEMRGMYVNKTLLAKYNLEIPTNRAELMNCCKVLYDAGYVPLQSTPGTFAQQFLYPSICNMIVNGGNYDEMYASIENIDDGVSEYFRDAYEFLYEIVEKGYYDYKKVEEELGFKFDDSDGKARDFFNVVEVSEDTYEKRDDVGQIAFLIDTQAFETYLSKAKSDYHSAIEYEFIVSPVGVDGGYGYLSPSDGLAINNKSDNVDWALEFLNFFFTPEISTQFAKETSKIPNTKDALLQFDIPDNRSSDVGQVTFSYNLYRVVTTLMMGGYDDMVGISKMNAKKYMIDNGDGTYSLEFTLEEYMARLEEEFQKIKAAR